MYQGRRIVERYVPPEAYAAFLRGVLADASHDFDEALRQFAIALAEDEDDPEIYARIGEVRCKRDVRDPEADRAYERAFALDALNAGALSSKARCMLLRGQPAAATVLLRRAESTDPTNVALSAFSLRTSAKGGDVTMQERAIALTVLHGDRMEAWDALIAWGYARKEASLVARGLAGLLRTAPERSLEVEKGAVALLAGGKPLLAREVAVAVADAPRALSVKGPRDATVARLAVDEALSRGDERRALLRATRGHVSLMEVAARAFLLKQSEIAHHAVRIVLDADPSASGARMVSVVLAKEGRAAQSHLAATDTPPSICAFVFAEYLAASAGSEAARNWLAQVVRAPMPALDPLAGPLAVDLVTRGILPRDALPAELLHLTARAEATE